MKIRYENQEKRGATSLGRPRPSTSLDDFGDAVISDH